ncbi:MAG: maleate cis-trans isomerase family protein [Hyphomicrobiales bacterium]
MSIAESHAPLTQALDPVLDAGPAPYKIGLIALSTDMVTERDFSLMLPPGDEVMYYTARVPNVCPVTVENLRRMAPHLAEAAAQILPTTPLDVIAYSCTSGSVSIGPDEVAAQIHLGRSGVEVVTPITAALAAFEALGIKRISLMTPYTDEVNRTMVAFIEPLGIEIANVAGFCLEDDQEMARLTPAGIRDAAIEITDPDADAVFVSCTGIRTAETLDAIEAALGKPALCSNQCMFWQSLRLAGYDKPVEGFGRLLKM